MFSRPMTSTTKGYASPGTLAKFILKMPHIVKLEQMDMNIFVCVQLASRSTAGMLILTCAMTVQKRPKTLFTALSFLRLNKT